MSAGVQNYSYVVGKQKPDAKPNVMSDKKLKQVKQAAERYLDKKRDAST